MPPTNQFGEAIRVKSFRFGHFKDRDFIDFIDMIDMDRVHSAKADKIIICTMTPIAFNVASSHC